MTMEGRTSGDTATTIVPEDQEVITVENKVFYLSPIIKLV